MQIGQKVTINGQYQLKGYVQEIKTSTYIVNVIPNDQYVDTFQSPPVTYKYADYATKDKLPEVLLFLVNLYIEEYDKSIVS